MTKEEYMQRKIDLMDEYQMGELSGDYYRKYLKQLEEEYKNSKEEVPQKVVKSKGGSRMKEHVGASYLFNLKEKKLQDISKEQAVSILLKNVVLPKDLTASKLNAMPYFDLKKYFPNHSKGIYQAVLANEGKWTHLILAIDTSKEKVENACGIIDPEEDKQNAAGVKLIKADSPKFMKQFYKNWSITWEGMSTDAENLKAIKEGINKAKGKFNGTFYAISGKFFNEHYGLTGKNAYPNNLTILVIDNDDCKGKDNLIMWIRSCGARWFTDVVDNNRRRQRGN